MVRGTLLVCLFAVLLPAAARSDVTINASPVGNDVVFTATGSLEVSGSPVLQSANVLRLVDPGRATVNIGAVGSVPYDLYNDLTSWPTEFGPGEQITTVIGFGDGLIVANNEVYRVPRDYVSGTPINSGMTFENQTLASLGLTLGTYQWVSPTDTITLNVVPEPAVAASVFLLALACPCRRRCGLLVRR